MKREHFHPGLPGMLKAKRFVTDRVEANMREPGYAHSPLPWRVERDARMREWLVDANGIVVVLNRANVRLIAEAVNRK